MTVKTRRPLALGRAGWRYSLRRQKWWRTCDVGSSHPGAGVGPKGWAVRPLKRHASWVQNVARQFGLYPSRAQEECGESLPVREDRSGWTAGEPVGGPPPPPGSHVQHGEALNASKREADPKMTPPRRAPSRK